MGSQVRLTARWSLLVLVCLVLLAALACSKNRSPVESDASGSHGTNSGYHPAGFPATVTAYDVKGVIEEIRANGWKAVIAHEEIPGYMQAMSMLLDVKDTNELGGLQPGDAIRFRMLVTDEDGWIDQVKKMGTGTLRSAPEQPVAAVFDELEPGDALPDCVLTNQFGKTVRLSDFKGQVLAFSFIFIRCPFPTYCPRMNNNLGAALQALSQPGTSTNWQLISISFDPAHDTPERLRSYAEGYHYDPAHWSFATGREEDIRRLGSQFGLAFSWRGGTIEHNVRTVVVNAEGKIQRIFGGNEWKPEELIAEMESLLRGKL